ncbi:lipase 3-like [Drosophila sulfurigaster albostrigata]|uniref:lipase 3-like n=1 Tax=Drosophila sulfurigaster albostrigata TaxID=89887 RepID=UPI002D21AC74|nr:lipase 3-like [Drosophila sulfurigaster albostrigata]
MQNRFLLALVFSVVAVGVLQSVALNIRTPDIDFYKLYNNPEAHVSLKGRRTTSDRIAAHGYPAEHHHIVTEDGYIVGVFRIPYSHKLQNQNEYRPIVLIQHGLLSCSDGWILTGPDDALAFMLADAGYDVWLGNARGNTYSRNHTSLSPKHPYFWRFSWHEIGHYDIAAMIDYALKTNGQGQKAIHYVGHSQGTTVFFTLMSTRPEYNEKIKTAHMFAPIAIMTNLESPFVRAVAPYLGQRNAYSLLFSCQEFIPHNEFLLNLLFNFCEPDQMLRPTCDSLIGDEGGRTNVTVTPEQLATHPAGCSTNQMIHYLQEQQSGHFRQYDHGTAKNLEVYGSETPPDYPVEEITSKVYLWYGLNDELAAVEDVLALADRLPNKEVRLMEDPLWDHGDFASNWKVREYLNEPVIQIMQEFEDAYN